jgi:hypothetical protein
MDLSNYRVLDERFRDWEKERQEYEREKALQQTRIITIEDMDDVAVPMQETDPEPHRAIPDYQERPVEVPPPPVVPR